MEKLEATSAVSVGDVLPPVVFGPVSRQTLALYAGASGDHNPIHIDSDFAKQAGVTDVFAHGMLSFGVLARAVTQWAGGARLRSFGTRFVSITNVHDVITCSGTVRRCWEEDGERRLAIEIAAAVQDGRQTLLGEAVVGLDG